MMVMGSPVAALKETGTALQAVHHSDMRAAQWRQHQRAAAAGERPRLIIREADVASSLDDDDPGGSAALEGALDGALRSLLGGAAGAVGGGGPLGGGGGRAPPALDVRERMSGILERDRGELWDSPD